MQGGNAPSDEMLVARVVQRDVAAFSLLYDRYSRPIYTLAVHLIGETEAEEIVQDVFMRLWDKAAQFDPARGSFAAWFMTIARNHLKDVLRSSSQYDRIVTAESIDNLLVEAADTDQNIEEEAWRQQQGERLLLALQSLPEEQRRALILAYFGDLSQSSIASYMNWPLGTVKKRIRLGLQKLRAFLKGDEITADVKPDQTEISASDDHEL